VSVRELAGVIARLCQAPDAPRHHPARAGEIRHSVGDPSRARALLGLGEPVALGEGLAQVVEWIRGARVVA
jgi:UDP-glucose 4-epimerase